jgi:bacillithiol biosynthesis deacetylase BshB1
LGTRGTPELREKESTDASKLLGIHTRERLSFQDGLFEINTPNRMEIVKLIRKHKPEIVLANAIEDRHPDHAKGATLVSESCFLSGLIKIETIGDDGNKQEASRPKAVYHYIQDRYIHPDFIIDITPFMKKKMEVIKAYRSQVYDPDSKEPTTPISTEEFLDFLYARAMDLGRIINVKYAEGFTAERTLGINSLFDLF